MSESSNLSSALAIASGALRAFAVDVQISAYNIANVSTSGFKPGRVDLVSGYRDKSVHPLILTQNEKQTSNSLLNDVGAVNSDLALEASGTDLATEFSHLIEAKNSFIANTKVIGVTDELFEVLLNLKA